MAGGSFAWGLNLVIYLVKCRTVDIDPIYRTEASF